MAAPPLEIRFKISVPAPGNGRAAYRRAASSVLLMLAVEILRASANWDPEGDGGREP